VHVVDLLWICCGLVGRGVYPPMAMTQTSPPLPFPLLPLSLPPFPPLPFPFPPLLPLPVGLGAEPQWRGSGGVTPKKWKLIWCILAHFCFKTALFSTRTDNDVGVFHFDGPVLPRNVPISQLTPVVSTAASVLFHRVVDTRFSCILRFPPS